MNEDDDELGRIDGPSQALVTAQRWAIRAELSIELKAHVHLGSAALKRGEYLLHDAACQQERWYGRPHTISWNPTMKFTSRRGICHGYRGRA